MSKYWVPANKSAKIRFRFLEPTDYVPLYNWKQSQGLVYPHVKGDDCPLCKIGSKPTEIISFLARKEDGHISIGSVPFHPVLVYAYEHRLF